MGYSSGVPSMDSNDRLASPIQGASVDSTPAPSAPDAEDTASDTPRRKPPGVIRVTKSTWEAPGACTIEVIGSEYSYEPARNGICGAAWGVWAGGAAAPAAIVDMRAFSFSQYWKTMAPPRAAKDGDEDLTRCPAMSRQRVPDSSNDRKAGMANRAPALVCICPEA